MKILIASDSHYNTDAVKELIKLYPAMDLYLYAGDSQDSRSNLYPFDSVKGNCDFYPFDEKRFIRLPCGNLLMKHLPFLNEEERKDIKIFIHGHTHVYKVTYQNKLLTICPGSLNLSRDSSGGSYCILECEQNEVIVKIYSLETKKVLLNGKYNLK